MIKIGMTLAERYEVLDQIGTGGMSDVYRAKDHKLNRFVAVKVLKHEFSENRDFLQKFRSEAQSAAGLMHLNIVNVYDVGEESGSHYIVMELVEGITLKKYIEKKARLSVKEAVSIAIQVAQGIEAAHNNHIIHRDIKPQNVIISMDGKVKVTDFGIAKAATSNTITSNVMGSVHYTSPEQVRGGFSDEKSDIYSLGITLFEMLTGRVPFNGDTTVAVAIKHIQEQMPSPRDYVPEIPVSLEKIVLKCTQKSPDRRYQSAPELIEDLKRSLISPDEDFVKLEDPDETGATKDISPQEIKKIRQQAHRRDSFDAQMNTGRMEEQEEYPPEEGYEEYPGEYAEGEYQEEYYEEYPGEYTEPGPERPRKKSGKKPSGNNRRSSGKKPSGRNASSGRKKSQSRKRNRYDDDVDPNMEVLTTILIIIAAVVVGFIFLYIVWNAVGLGQQDQEQGSSNVTAAPTQEAAAPTEAAAATGTEEPTQQAGNAIVPDVEGLPKAEARAKLEAEGFVVEVTRSNSDTVEKDTVISQDPKGDSKIARGGTVTIELSLGKESTQVPMPDLKGKTEEEAKEILEELGITEFESTGEEYSDKYEEGTIIWQNISAGITVDIDTEVEYKLSKGREFSLYDLDYTVAAPADYADGDAAVELVDPTYKQLWSTTTANFPVQIHMEKMEAEYGYVVVHYFVNEEKRVTDANGDVSVQIVRTQKDSAPIKVDFTRSKN